jgi:hypothetical protein
MLNNTPCYPLYLSVYNYSRVYTNLSIGIWALCYNRFMSYTPGFHISFNGKPPERERHFWAVPGTHIRFVPVRFLDDGVERIVLRTSSAALA